MSAVIYLIYGDVPQPGPVPVFKISYPEGTVESLSPRLEEVNHSPDGFNVGYMGSGPHQLSYAMCRDYVNTPGAAERVYRYVCRELVAKMQRGKVLVVTDDELRRHIISANESK
jgi:hypothetical protein